MLNDTTRFHRVTQKRGDPQREPILHDHETRDGDCCHKGFAFECKPQFASLLVASTKLLAACKAVESHIAAWRTTGKEPTLGTWLALQDQLHAAIAAAEQQ